MSRPLFWLVPALAAAACTGLYLDNGNAYPCDFSKPPGERDAVCVAGDVCGIDNVCRKYLYEGPRFEGAASVPVYGAGSGEGARLHPLVLKDPLTDVVRSLPLNSGERSALFARTEAGQLFAVSAQGNIAAAEATLAPNVVTAQPFMSGGPHLLLRTTDDDGLFVDSPLARDRVLDVPAPPWVLRFIDAPPQGGRFSQRAIPLVVGASAIGFLEEEPGTPPPPNPPTAWRVRPAEVPLDGGLLDVGGLTQPGRLWLAMLGNGALNLAERSVGPDGGSVFTPSAQAPLTPVSAVQAGALRTDLDGRIISAVRRGTRSDGTTPLEVLSTWQVSFTATGPALTQAWPDCQPCQRAGQRIEALSASVATGAPVVEVVCGPVDRTTLRVVGSVALNQSEQCRTESFQAPVDLERVKSRWDHQSGLLFGGATGELWSGETISGLTPMFLDRVPRDVAPSLTAGQRSPSLAAIGDDFLSVLQTPDTLRSSDAGLERLNGFRRIDPSELGVSADERLLGLLHGTPGWGVTATGQVVRTLVSPTGLTLDTAGRVVTASGTPIRSSIGGEAFVANDGGLQALFVAADDSLYFVREPRNLVGLTSEEKRLAPDLTPEPSVPIRSLALERTPLGTDGVNRARGYLVTSRNVYAWQLSGAPARWSSTLLRLPGGEPMEVWFDSPRGALGRVGFRDGEIDSLPGGYQLVEPLPSADGGVTPQVKDYENLGGWPVAYATTGLFVAGWDLVDGKLQNRFPDGGINRPMSWRPLTLPDGGTPWMQTSGLRAGSTRDAKLFVAVDPPDDAGLRNHRLLLFLDEQVLQVAHHLRK
jgi:hypothetical protein